MTASAVALPRRPKRGKRMLLLAVAVAALAAGSWYGRMWWDTVRWLEATDDAYVGGDTTPIAPQVAGRIADVLVTDNQRVNAGQLLLKIDPRSYQATLDRAQATVAQQEASLENLQARLDIQHLAIRQAQADLVAKTAAADFADQELTRYTSLARSSAGSVQNAQKARTDKQQTHANVDAAGAALESSKKELTALQSQISQARAAILAAKADVQTASLDLERTEIRSPIDGYVGNRAAQRGSYVQPGTYLLTIVPVGGLWVDANFKEDQLELIRSGQPASIVAEVAPGRALHGHVASVSPATGAIFSVIPPQNATGNFTKIVQRVPVRIRLDDYDEGEIALRPGLSTTVTVDTQPR